MTCLSDLYYKIGSWFTIAMYAIAIVTLPFALDIWDSAWSFLMCAGITFVGCAADYKGKEHDLHFIAACISGVSSLIWVAHVCPQSFYALFFTLSLSILDTRRWLLWCELTCFSMVFFSIITH